MTMDPHRERFEVEAILSEAATRTGGLEDLGDGPFVEPLGLFLESLEREARLNDLGRLIARERALLHTVNRLNYVNDRKRFPGICDERIVAPVFIIGFPRTGTTILHDILAQDPDSRAPLTWETMFPSPPPEAATFETDPRIALCAATLPTPETETERDRQFRAMHPMGATLSQECVTMMGEAMCTPLFHNQFRVPSYEDWIDLEADWSHVYDFHEHQLQHLQWHNHRDRWVLKTGAHMWGLEHLLRKYPDARIVFTHRDPAEVGDLLRQPHHPRALHGKRRRGPFRDRAGLDREAPPGDRARHGGPQSGHLPPGRLLRHALLGLRGRPIRGRRARSTRRWACP